VLPHYIKTSDVFNLDAEQGIIFFSLSRFWIVFFVCVLLSDRLFSYVFQFFSMAYEECQRLTISVLWILGQNVVPTEEKYAYLN